MSDGFEAVSHRRIGVVSVCCFLLFYALSSPAPDLWRIHAVENDEQVEKGEAG